MGWGPLRVITRTGSRRHALPTHAHRDMEIITYVLGRRPRASRQPRHRLRDPPGRGAADERGHRRAPQRAQRVETEPVLFCRSGSTRACGYRARVTSRRRSARPSAGDSCVSSRPPTVATAPSRFIRTLPSTRRRWRAASASSTRWPRDASPGCRSPAAPCSSTASAWSRATAPPSTTRAASSSKPSSQRRHSFSIYPF